MTTEQPQATSLLGKPLYSSTSLQGQDMDKLQRLHDEAKAAWEADEDDVQKFMLYVLRLDAMHRYDESIPLYTQGMERWPEEPMLYCHRGHRYLNIREFDLGMADLVKANEMKPDSSDILYHLGLAHYMKGEYEQALEAFIRGYEVTSDDADNPPTSALNLVASADIIRMGSVDWIYITLSRLGRFDEAEKWLDLVDPNMKAGGNMIFYLTRVLFYKGVITEEEAVARFKELGRGAHSMGYGLGQWHLARGNRNEAKEYFQGVVDGSPMWPAWAFIASEIELARGL